MLPNNPVGLGLEFYIQKTKRRAQAQKPSLSKSVQLTSDGVDAWSMTLCL